VLARLKQIQQDGATTGQKAVWNGSKWAPAVKDNLSAAAAPTVNDDSTAGYEVGSLWINTAALTPAVYSCVDASAGAAVWRNLAEQLRVEWMEVQAGHGFSLGTFIRQPAAWTTASAATLATHALGMVSEVIDVNTFLVCREGIVSWPAHGLVVGSLYYLSTGGAISTTPNTNWVVPALVPLGANNVLVLPMRETPVRIAGESVSSGTVTDFLPTGNATVFSECVTLRWSPPADIIVNSLTPQDDDRYPRLKQITNVNGSNYITLKQDDGATGTASYRILNESGVDLVIPPQSSCWIWYDRVNSRWRTFGLTIHRNLTPAIEIRTGEIWNGKPVYRIHSNGGALASGTTTLLASGATEIVRAYGHIVNTSNNRETTVNWQDGTNNAYAYRDTVTGAIAIFAQAAGAFTGNAYSVTVEYTK